jgi:hypothetical protein
MATLIDSYSESNYSESLSFTPAYTEWGQSFTGNGLILNSAVFYLVRQGSATGSMTARVYTHSGVYGTSSVPTGTALAISDSIDASTVSNAGFALVTFTFSGAQKFLIANATNYVVTLQYTNADASNYISMGGDNTSPTASGNYSFYTSGNWLSSSFHDLLFYVYGDPQFSPSVSEIITVTDSRTLNETSYKLNLSQSALTSDALTDIRLVSPYSKGNFFRLF